VASESFQLQRCRTCSIRISRHHTNLWSASNRSLATVCLKWLAQPRMIWLSLISKDPNSCCDCLWVRARIFTFTDRMGRSAMKV
jgi:hypothetical protein